VTVELNHTIIHSRDREASARFLADLLGLEVGAPWGPFLPVDTGNGVTLHFATSDREIAEQHYAFLVSDDVFDRCLARLRSDGVDHAADPFWRRPGEINHDHGGRGVYFRDPSGHGLEVITQPYGADL
jgi:catechol 2,3-dioxygenase-like lactoylglutathione lyase family enzyme